MLVTHEREKLINTIIYFAKNTQHAGKIKLFKLLYLLDFEHFRMTGRSVTGLNYHAWKYGPVPITLAEEWDEPQSDMAASIAIQSVPVIDYVREEAVPRPGVEFDDSHFTKRELRIMAALAEQYRDVYSHTMIDVTHAENGAWTKVWDGGRGSYHPIAYALALADDDPQREAVLEMAREHEALIHSV